MKTITDHRGSLTVIEKLPFQIKRVYYLHSVDPTQERTGHAHRNLERLMIAAHGSFRLTMPDRVITMNDPKIGVFIPKMTWITVDHLSADAVCLVLASEEHDEADCIRDYSEYLK